MMKEKVENEGQENKSSVVRESSLPNTVVAIDPEPWLPDLLCVDRCSKAVYAALKRAVAHSVASGM